MKNKRNISYIINHLGEERKQYFNAISPPIIQTSNFTFNSVSEFREHIQSERTHHIYTRGNNPTVHILAQKLAALEGAETALLVGSGAAAISNAVIANVKGGDHVVCVNNAYSWANNLLTKLLPRFGVSTTFIDGTDIDNFKNAIQDNTSVIYLESPTSIVFDLQDLRTVAELAKSHRIITILDKSYATPLSKSAIVQGIDIVIHSATKYISGHSDVVAGVIASNAEMIEKIFHGEYMTLGNILSPNDAWLVLRGLRTLPARLQQTSQTATKILAYFQSHPQVEYIFHPFLPSHPQCELAKTQMTMPMSLFSVQFKTQQLTRLDAFCDALQYFLTAVSWGGHESLALPITVNYKGEELAIVRFYVGLENAELLIDDLEQSMQHLH
jgi:cystathionine beta-lyase/cystathionine gamma-synthase